MSLLPNNDTASWRVTFASARGDRLVPRLHLGSIRVVVDVVERARQGPQCNLVVEGARFLRRPDDHEGRALARPEISTIECRLIGGDGAAAKVGHRVAFVPLVRRPE